jgi:hypothetical protein
MLFFFPQVLWSSLDSGRPRSLSRPYISFTQSGRQRRQRTTLQFAPRTCHPSSVACATHPASDGPTTSTACAANTNSSATPCHATYDVTQATSAHPQRAFRSFDATASHNNLGRAPQPPRTRDPYIYTSNSDLRAHRSHRPRRKLPSSRWGNTRRSCATQDGARSGAIGGRGRWLFGAIAAFVPTASTSTLILSI